jgi:hypothetical protein
MRGQKREPAYVDTKRCIRRKAVRQHLKKAIAPVASGKAPRHRAGAIGHTMHKKARDLCNQR